jgi:hypothetical protein
VGVVGKVGDDEICKDSPTNIVNLLSYDLNYASSSGGCKHSRGPQ